MLATKRAKELIQTGNFKVDAVYIGVIPQSEITRTDRTIILITDVRTDLALDGNLDFHALNKEVEVQIFYALDANDPDDFETSLMHLFVRNGWTMLDNHGHTVDPKTYQVTQTYYFDYYELEK